MPFWILEGSISRKDRTRRDGAESHMTGRGVSAIQFLSPLTSGYTQAHSDSPSRSKDKSRIKAGFLSGDSWLPRHNSLFWPGLDPSRAGSLHGLRFAELPPGKQYGLKCRQLGSQNRKLSKALISLPVFITSNADTGYHQTSRPFYCLVSWTLISCFPSTLLATPKPLIV